MRQEYLNSWKVCKGCRQSRTLMSEPLLCRTKDLHAVSRQKLKMAVGLLTGHTTPRAHMFKIGLAQWQDCQLCKDEKEDSVHIVWHCPAEVRRRYRTLGCMFLISKDLKNMRVNGLISLVANTGLGIVP